MQVVQAVMHVLMAIFTSKKWLQIYINFCGCGLSVLLNADQNPCLFRAKRNIVLSKILFSFIVVKDLQASLEDFPL